jgi:unsaturated chondroitin disaccharide hydrolase
MIRLDTRRTPADLLPKIARLFALSARKIRSIDQLGARLNGAPVFTAKGLYTTRGWTEWTQGFVFGSALLQFDAEGDEEFLDLGRTHIVQRMASHLTHMGVHDHGFNNVSTYGNLWRLAREGRIAADDWEQRYYELALKVSGAVQARRWTALGVTPSPEGFIHSFNGPHSLFVDTIRSLRSLALGHLLGQRLMEEQDRPVNLLDRLLTHAKATAEWSVYYGTGRDRFDVPENRGRTAHESLFNVESATYRGPSTQQGFSPFSTWTRGLAWAMLGFTEQIEFVGTLHPTRTDRLVLERIGSTMLDAARATCDHYLDIAAADGVPYWDDGAPGLERIAGWRDRPADPFNDHEPVDSSAAAIAAQGLLRLGRILSARGEAAHADRYEQAGLRVLDTLLDEPYLSTAPDHQGLLLHSVYHWPNRWDYVPPGSKIPRGESSQWGDYHLREAALYVKRLAENGPYLTFFGPPLSERDASTLVSPHEASTSADNA